MQWQATNHRNRPTHSEDKQTSMMDELTGQEKLAGNTRNNRNAWKHKSGLKQRNNRTVNSNYSICGTRNEVFPVKLLFLHPKRGIISRCRKLRRTRW